MRPRSDGGARAVDDDGLQADVMRFMAIIAFCLVAIMALAREAVPLDAPRIAEADALPAPSPAAPAAPVAGGEAGTARTVEPPTEAEPARPGPERVVRVAAPVAPEPERDPPAPAPEVREVTIRGMREAPAPAEAPAVAGAPVAPEARETPEAPAAPETEEEGLVLRFASHGDFLRLVHRGGVELFAFREDAVRVLSPGIGFRPARPPGRLYELLPETIPSLLRAQLAEQDAGVFSWGIRMPEPMERRVRGLVDDGARGALVIDRHGDVRLAGAAPDREPNS